MIGDFLMSEMKKADINPYQLSKLTAILDSEEKLEKRGVSQPYIRNLINGQVEQVSPKKLRLLAKALKVPYLEMMAAAGYIDEKDVDPARRLAQLKIGPLMDGNLELVDLFYDKGGLQLLEAFKRLPDDKKEQFLKSAKALASSYLEE